MIGSAESEANLVSLAAVSLGFFSALGFGPAAGLAAGVVLTLVLDAAVGTDAEGILRNALGDLITAIFLLFFVGVGWLVGLAVKQMIARRSGG